MKASEVSKNSADPVAEADRAFRAAIRAIDSQFGEGYARKNPALVAQFMEVAASAIKKDAEENGAS